MSPRKKTGKEVAESLEKAKRGVARMADKVVDAVSETMPKKRTVRTKSEIKRELEEKIAYHKRAIDSLEKRIQELDHPKKAARISEKGKLKKIFEKAAAEGKSPAEIAGALGIEIPEEWK